MSVDIRSRVDGEVEAVDPARCFGELLPRRSSDERDRLDDARPRVRAAPLVLEVDGDAWTLADDDGTVRVRAGRADDAETVLRLSAAQLERPRHRSGHGGRHADQRIARPTRRTFRRVARLVAPAPWRARRPRAARARRGRPRRRVGRAPRARPQLHRRRATRRHGRLPPTRGVPPHRPACSPKTRWPRCPRDMDARRAHLLARRRPVVVGAQQRRRRPARAHAALRRGVARGRAAGRRRAPAAPRRPHRRRPRVRQHGRTTASRRCSSRSTWSRASPTCRGTRTARSAVTATTAAA